MQIALIGTVRMRVTLGQRGRKDYALLNAKRIMYISFVINAFKKIFVLLMLIKCFCVHKYIYFLQLLKIFLGFLIWRWFFECGTSWSLEAPSDGDLLCLFLCGWSGSHPESQLLEIL